MKENLRIKIEKHIQYLEYNKGNLVIDADTHISDVENMPENLKESYNQADYYHGKPISREDLLMEMELADIDMALIWQNPAVTVYPGKKDDNYKALYHANAYIFNTREKYPQKFIPAGWTDPKALGMDKALELVDTCVKEFGFPIVKLNPAQNEYPIDSDTVFTIVDRIIETGATPAFHYGADTPYTPVSGLARLAEKYSGIPLLAVHMGGGGASYGEAEQQYTETRQLGLQYPNIKFVLSAKRDTHIESDLITYTLAGQPFCKNLCCASDAPYGRQTWNFGGFRLMFQSLIKESKHTDQRVRENPGLFTDDVIQGYMGRNFAEIVIDSYRRILS